ncbi:hypothetical protein MIR68_009189 [Amoeboaphelidium protococcarum]|nr:hypothetical protein MIR68_009189 [Amoeboaphelidium protococcarum]
MLTAVRQIISKRLYRSPEYPQKVWKPVLSQADAENLSKIYKTRNTNQRPKNIVIKEQDHLQSTSQSKLSESTLGALLKIKQQAQCLITSPVSTQAQSAMYATVEINQKPFSVLKNDIVITKRLKHTKVGDELLLTRIREIGTRDYFLKGQPLVPSENCIVKAMVLEHTLSAKYITYRRRVGQGPGDRKWRKRSYRDHLTTLRITDIDVNIPQSSQ